jgi:inosine-uridine nucleoside N-ribohydrolase
MTATRRIVVDTDTGIDDALALLYLAGRPDAEIVAVTSVYGNCAERDVVRNIGYVCGLLGLNVPVARGAAGPLGGAARIARHAPGVATGWARGPVNVRSDRSGFRARLMRTHEGLPPSFPYDPAPATRVVTAVDARRFVAGFVEVLGRREESARG